MVHAQHKPDHVNDDSTPAAPISHARSIYEGPCALPDTRPSPLAGSWVDKLRSLSRELAKGGIPPRDTRPPNEDARLVAFFVLHELLVMLDKFASGIVGGERVRLSVKERCRKPGEAIIELCIEREE